MQTQGTGETVLTKSCDVRKLKGELLESCANLLTIVNDENCYLLGMVWQRVNAVIESVLDQLIDEERKED